MRPPCTPTAAPPTELVPKGYANRCSDRTGYLTPVGKLPSVTTVVGATKSDSAKAALAAWLARPGGEERSKAACARGTYLHTQVENWITGRPTCHHIAFGNYWKGMKPWLKENFHSSLGVECPVWHPAGFSGTFDCLGWTYDSCEIKLLDWKTSVRYREPEGEIIRGYYVQLAAYRAAISWTYGVDVQHALLVVARPLGKPDLYPMDPQLLNECEEEFFDRLRRYQAHQQSLEPVSHVVA
jgi:hypothetical protein